MSDDLTQHTSGNAPGESKLSGVASKRARRGTGMSRKN